MTNEKFSALLSIISSQTIELISKNMGKDEIKAAEDFYASDVYALLEDESTKVWHFSPLTLFNMFEEEATTGIFVIPEET